MHSIAKISEKLYYIGVNDRRLELFENMFPLTKGVSYNSYLLLDEKTVLFDSVEISALNQFLENLQFALAGRDLDYMIINHMEPDHASGLSQILKSYPNVKIIGNAKTFTMIKRFLKEEVNQIVVKEGDVIETGEHKLTFVMAPMVHWPEVMVTYDTVSKTLFSADAYGTFGALDGRIFADEYDFDHEFLDEARRYFTNIVGKYGAQAASAINKAVKLEIDMICPLHGPVLRGDMINYFTEKQLLWSEYKPEKPEEIALIYASMYGNTESVVNSVAMKLSAKGKKVHVLNACNTDKSYLVAECFKCGSIIFACPTYNGAIYPTIETLLLDIKSLNLKDRAVYTIENGSWAPTAGRKICEIMSSMKSMAVKANLTVHSADCPEEKIDEFVSSVK